MCGGASIAEIVLFGPIFAVTCVFLSYKLLIVGVCVCMSFLSCIDASLPLKILCKNSRHYFLIIRIINFAHMRVTLGYYSMYKKQCTFYILFYIFLFRDFCGPQNTHHRFTQQGGKTSFLVNRLLSIIFI